MPKIRPVATIVTAVAAAALVMWPQPNSPTTVASVDSANGAGEATYLYRVANAAGQADKLFGYGFDVLEQRTDQDLFVLGNKAAGDRLNQVGFTATVDEVVPAPNWTPPAKRSQRSTSASDVNETYYGGYHTVGAQFAHLDQVAANHTDLASTVTYGQSWRQSKGQPGYDLKAICITKKAAGDCQRSPNSAKPRFFLMSQIHAREITTGDVSWRWIDYLVNGYGNDQAVTQLMDTTEMWVVPVANPDGVDIVQQGGNSPRLQRKNADNSHGSSCGTGQTGVDLNRNTSAHWDTSGVSHNACSEVYDGPSANSEIENSSLEKLFSDLYPARRPAGDAAPAPADTKGLMITMHSNASMVLFPWGYDSGVHTGNDASLRALAKNMASITGYRYGQPGEILYNASGTTDDWIYDKLGVASFTIEIGDKQNQGCDGFLPKYSCQNSVFWPKLRPALLYAAQHAPAPYQTH